MYADISKPPAPLPTAKLTSVCPGVSLQTPLSRRGHGPGIILLIPESEDLLAISDAVPSPVVKWSEEGYTVVAIQPSALSSGSPAPEVLKQSLAALESSTQCEPKDKIGLVAYDSELWSAIAPALFAADVAPLAACVVYLHADDEPTLANTSVPTLRHVAGTLTNSADETTSKLVEVVKRFTYPKAATGSFAIPFQPDFVYSAEAVSHTRSLSFLKPLMNGPYFDLESIWEEHTFYEFADRSAEHTMSTMVQEPYVNHVTTVTGGIGRDDLTEFYRQSFIFSNPDDTGMDLISRTVGIDRIVDEFVFSFTHDREIPWMLPGIPPTGRKVEIPFTAVVNIRGDRLFHEHIAWDQGSVLAQLGLMPRYLPYPYPVEGKYGSGEGRYEYQVPVFGKEITDKLVDKKAVPSNEMFKFQLRKC